VVAICGCWFEEDCWWLCFWGQVGCDSMTSMCCIALICISCHMKRIHRTELVLWISAPDMLQQHCLPYEENLKSRASFVDLRTWHVAALPAIWRELKKQSFFCGSLCLTCCSIVREKLKLLPCCCPLVGACLQRIVDGFTFKIKSRIQFHDSVHCLPHEENSKSFLCWFMTCPSIAREAPPLLLPFVGCLQPEEEEECRWLHSQDQVGCYSVSVHIGQREALPLLLPVVGGCNLKKIVDVCALETGLDASL
jgi:hypothetical protein